MSDADLQAIREARIKELQQQQQQQQSTAPGVGNVYNIASNYFASVRF